MHSRNPQTAKLLAEHEEDFANWVTSVAEELTAGRRKSTPYGEALALLVGPDGRLLPDDEGYPVAYGYPEYIQEEGTELVRILYEAAFEPDQKTEKEAGRVHASLRLYPNIYDPEKGIGECVGVMESRTSSPAGGLPDRLVFNAGYIYVKGLACSSEAELFDLYKGILERRIEEPARDLAEDLSAKALDIARQANLAESDRDLAVTLLGLAANAVSEHLTRAEESMYYHVLDALQDGLEEETQDPAHS